MMSLMIVSWSQTTQTKFEKNSVPGTSVPVVVPVQVERSSVKLNYFIFNTHKVTKGNVY